MKKTIAALILAAAATTPAFASDGSEIANAQVHPAYVGMSDGMQAYASVRGANWRHAQDANIRQQAQIQWEITDR